MLSDIQTYLLIVFSELAICLWTLKLTAIKIHQSRTRSIVEQICWYGLWYLQIAAVTLGTLFGFWITSELIENIRQNTQPFPR